MKIVAVFPGQGSQTVGMGKTLAETFPIARRTFEEASDALGFDVLKLCLEGPAEKLQQTENTQPCLLTTSIAAYGALVQECGITPYAAAGHSLGEYSALVATGALDFSRAVRWVRARGQAMQKAVPAGQGGMSAVLGVDEADLVKICEQAATDSDPVEPANFNAPGQIVVSGTVAGLAKLPGLAPKAKLIPLAVSAPFHCSLMAPAREAMAKLFETDGVTPNTPKFPYVSNVDAKFVSTASEILPKLLNQLNHAVRWQQSIELLLSEEPTVFVECGPGAVLQGLGKRIAKAESAKRSIEARWVGVSDVETLKAFQTLGGTA